MRFQAGLRPEGARAAKTCRRAITVAGPTLLKTRAAARQSEVSPLLMMKAPVQGRAAPQNQKLVICGFLCTIFLQFWHVPDWRSHTGTGDAQAQRWRTGAQRVPSCTASKPVKCRIVSCSVMHRRCKATVTEKDQQQTAVELVCTVIFVGAFSLWLNAGSSCALLQLLDEGASQVTRVQKQMRLVQRSGRKSIPPPPKPELVQAPPDRRFRGSCGSSGVRCARARVAAPSLQARRVGNR